jgi:hypothetical protein
MDTLCLRRVQVAIISVLNNKINRFSNQYHFRAGQISFAVKISKLSE